MHRNIEAERSNQRNWFMRWLEREPIAGRDPRSLADERDASAGVASHAIAVQQQRTETSRVSG